MKHSSNRTQGSLGMNTKLLGAIGFGLLSMAANGCSNESKPTQPNEPNKPSSALAVVAHSGDVTPVTLHARPELTAIKTLVYVSMPLPTGTPLVDDGATPSFVTSTDALKIAPKGVADPIQTLPIDAPGGEAMLFLGPQVEDPAAIEAALDGIKVFDPEGKPVNLRAHKQTWAGEHPKPMSAIPFGQHPAGIYTIKLDPIAVKAGVALDAHQPDSSIVMKMKPSTYEHLLGVETDVVDMYLADGTKELPGADVVGTLLDPDLKPVRPLVFKDRGRGHYRASLGGSTFTAKDQVGAYLVDIKATGKTASGREFLRSGRTGFHFGIPTARVQNISAMRTLKDASGVIEAFEIDVQLESSALDRLEISATLSAHGVDGAEHPVVVALTGDAYDPGTHKVTLRFDAGNIRATHMTGPYEVKNLKVFSIGTNTLFERIANVDSAGFAAVSLTELKPLAIVPPGVQTMIDEGKLFKD